MFEMLAPWQNIVFLFVALFTVFSIFYGRLKLRLLLFLIITVVLAVVLSYTTKSIFYVERPCYGNDQCPESPAFPSGHAAFAFSFALPLIGEPVFPVLIILGWLTGLSRVLLGVHTWYDVIGGIGYAGLSMYIAGRLVNIRSACAEAFGKGKTEPYSKEILRQLVHMSAGLLFMLLFLFVQTDTTLKWLTVAFVLGTFIMHIRSFGIRFPLVDWIFNTFERKGKCGHGALWFACGTFIMIGIVRSVIPIISMLWILSFGDAFSTLIGKRFGKHRLPKPFDTNKTIEGALAFFVSSLPACIIFQSPISIIMVAVSTLVEALDLKIDDNLTIPIMNSIIFVSL